MDVNAVKAAYTNHKIEVENKLYDLALLMKAYCVSIQIQWGKTIGSHARTIIAFIISSSRGTLEKFVIVIEDCLFIYR